MRRPDKDKTIDLISPTLDPSDIAPRLTSLAYEGTLKDATCEDHSIVGLVTFNERLTMGGIVAIGVLMVVAFVYWLGVVF